MIRLGIAPIGWSNDDLPELGGHIALEQCLHEMHLAGFEGCELGHKFPREAKALRKCLQLHELQLASGWFSTFFTEGRSAETIEGFIGHRDLLHAMGCQVIVVCECGHGIQGKPVPVLEQQPQFSDTQWSALFEGLRQLGALAQEKQMKIVYHPHMGTGVQSVAEIDHLLENVDPEHLSLLLDTGHLAYAGEEATPVIQKHFERIHHVHLKDIRRPILEQTQQQSLSFLDSVKAGVFTVPGDGSLDFINICKTLISKGYSGWWVIEAEQDPEKANPLEYAKKGRNFLRYQVGL